MIKYYTRVCNFYYGDISKKKVSKKISLPLNGNKLISFDTIEIISRKNIQRINVRKLNNLQLKIKKKVLYDIKQVSKKKYLKV